MILPSTRRRRLDSDDRESDIQLLTTPDGALKTQANTVAVNLLQIMVAW